MELANGKYTSEDALNGKGPFVRLTIEKTKVAPYLLNESIELYLPVYGTWQQLTAWPVPDEQSENSTIASSDLSQEWKDKILALPPDEKKAMEYILGNPGGVKRENIDRICSCKEGKSLKILIALRDKGYVIKAEEGKNTFYKPKPNLN